MAENISILFVAVIIVSLLTYFERPDYNLPLFIFIFLLWEHPLVKQKVRMWYLIVLSLITDVIWIVYWSATWQSYNNTEADFCNFTLLMSVICCVLKLMIAILALVDCEECSGALSDLGENVQYVFNGPED